MTSILNPMEAGKLFSDYRTLAAFPKNYWLALLLCLFLYSLPQLGFSTTDATTTTTPEMLLIKHVNLINMFDQKASILRDYSILIEGDTIKLLRPSADIAEAPNTKIVDGKDRFVLPGLIDAHVHVWDHPELAAYLAHGITTIQNASGMPFLLRYAEEIAAGKRIGPRLITTGPILNGQGPNTQPNHKIISTAAEAKAAVKKQYREGYRRVKVYSNLSRETYEAARDEAQSLGMAIMGHTPEGVRDPGIPYKKAFRITFEELLDDNFSSIEHMESIVWHALRDQLEPNKLRPLAKRIASRSVSVSPTLIAHHNLIKVAQSQGEYLSRPGIETLNPFIVSMEDESYTFWSTQKKDVRRDYHDFYLRATKVFFDEGVNLISGSDAGIFTNIPGDALLEELELYVEAGLNPYQALQTSTINAAKALGLSTEIGQIKEGYRADLILFDEDPTADIKHLRSLSALVRQGKWHDATAIAQLKAAATQTSFERSKKQVLESLSAQ